MDSTFAMYCGSDSGISEYVLVGGGENCIGVPFFVFVLLCVGGVFPPVEWVWAGAS